MKEESEVRIEDICCELVTKVFAEPVLLHAFRERKAGEWTSVENLCEQFGIPILKIKPELVMTWLPDPFGDTNFVVIIFFDAETKQSFVASYNQKRLLTKAENFSK